jgi:hypothetical protein
MDGRKYRGYWLSGKRHGSGEYYNPKTGIWKKGKWENDVRIKENENSTNSIA